jgi:hypothetical protein
MYRYCVWSMCVLYNLKVFVAVHMRGAPDRVIVQCRNCLFNLDCICIMQGAGVDLLWHVGSM